MKLQLSLIAILALAPRVAEGHGLLTVPSSKNGGTVTTPTESTSLHYAIASYGIIDKAYFDSDHSMTPWKRPGEFDHVLARDLMGGHPETLHPCGCNAAVDVGHCAGVSQARGFGETTQGGGTTVTPPIWARGSTQETAWNAWVNHAGGHIYMLCKKSTFDQCRDSLLPPDPFAATQDQQDAYLECVWDCFESNTLEWDDSSPSTGEAWTQKLQYRDDRCTYVTMEPTTKIGKDGHLWRYTPIPDSLQVTNGGEGKCTWDSVSSFSSPEAREKFVASFGEEDVCDWGLDQHAPSDWHVFDRVRVPSDVEEGEYLLGWRWDAYAADQMWTNCADVMVGPPASGWAEDDDGCEATPSTSSPTKSPSKGGSSTSTPTKSPEKQTTSAPTKSPEGQPPAPTPGSPNCPAGYSGIRPLDDCTKYHHCQNGEVVGDVHPCHPGTLFDFDYQYCNWANLVTCEEANGAGCYSSNFRDCNVHPDFQRADASCHTVWLPDGGRNSCVALWGTCTNQGGGSCCEPAVCYQSDDGGAYAQCIPPS